MPATLKCKNCGGDLAFSPVLQLWKCEWCDKEHTKADLQDFTQTVDQAQGSAGTAELRREQTEDGVVVTYKCSYCGAEVVTAEETAATFCVYCQRPVTISSQVSGEFKPTSLLPFRFTKDNAMDHFKTLIKGKRFLPNSYKSNQNIERIAGVYIPFWLFDGTVYFDLQGEGDIITTSRQGDYRVTKTDTHRVVRAGQLGIKNVPVDASAKTPDDIMDSIEPYDFSDLRPFAAPYLSGFLAERWDVSSDDCFPRAERRAYASTDKKINGSLTTYNRVRKHKDEKSTENIGHQYSLLPVWMLHTIYGGKDYLFAMNGQTGKMLGNMPMDKGKVFRFALIVFGISGTLCGLAGLALRMSGYL